MKKPHPGEWSEREVAKLKRLAGTMPVRDLIGELQRSRGAILAKAFSLRVSLDCKKTANRNDRMLKADVICPKCNAGLRRIELSSLRSAKSEYRCPICEQVLEVFDGSKKVAYRLTVPPVKALERL